MTLHPKVDPLGVCKHYEKKRKHYEPVPGDTLGSIVDREVCRITEPLVSSMMSSQMSSFIEGNAEAIVSSTLSTVIGPAIDEKLNTSFPTIEGNRLINDYNSDGNITGDEISDYNDYKYSEI